MVFSNIEYKSIPNYYTIYENAVKGIKKLDI